MSDADKAVVRLALKEAMEAAERFIRDRVCDEAEWNREGCAEVLWELRDLKRHARMANKVLS